MNSIIKGIRIATDLVILTVMSLELKDQLEKCKRKRQQRQQAQTAAPNTEADTMV